MAGIHSDRLRAARALIATPEAWTKGAYARTASGRLIGFECDAAACFCGYGAILRVTPDDIRGIRTTIAYLRGPAGENWVDWQDRFDTTHDQVLTQFDWAIAQAEAEGN